MKKKTQNNFNLYDWSSNVYLKDVRVSKSIMLSEQFSEEHYELPKIVIHKKFSNLLCEAYQKCFYGPLTRIPRPLS